MRHHVAALALRSPRYVAAAVADVRNKTTRAVQWERPLHAHLHDPLNPIGRTAARRKMCTPPPIPSSQRVRRPEQSREWAPLRGQTCALCLTFNVRACGN